MNARLTLFAPIYFFLFCLLHQPTAAQVTWTPQTAAEQENWFSVAYGNDIFVAVGFSGSNRIMTSPDGINWTARTAPELNDWTKVIYANGLFVAVAYRNAGPGGSNWVMTSPDGINWTARTAAENNTWFGLTYGNGLFVAVSQNGTNQVMTSPDGINWTARMASHQALWTAVTYGNGLFVAVATNNDIPNPVMTSPDGINWTAQTPLEQKGWRNVTYGNGSFVAISTTGTNRVMTSPDGVNWTLHMAAAQSSWAGITYANGVFVAVAYSGDDRVMTSEDGMNWTARMAAENNAWFGVTYGKGIFVAVANTGTNRVMISDFVLPVELVLFEGKAVKTGVQLLWQTATETNNQGFEVQRSKDGQHWQPLTFVKGHGTTLETQNYLWLDERPLPGVNYYRLKQVDTDGTFEYSAIVQVSTKEEAVEVFPNPVGDILNYQTTALESVQRVQLFDATGKLVKETTNINGQLSLQDVPKGVYVFVLETANGIVQQRIVKE